MTETSKPGREIVNGEVYLMGPRGTLQLERLAKPQDLLEDEVVREIHEKGVALAKAISEFRVAAESRIDVFNQLLWDQYEQKPRGVKGNQTLQTYDTCKRVLRQISDLIEFGPSLQVAKDAVMKCVRAWGEGSRPELVAVIENAFRLDKAGQINRGALLQLLSLNITDADWLKGMEAIRDSMRVVGTKSYLRLAWRETPEGEWQNINLNLAKS